MPESAAMAGERHDGSGRCGGRALTPVPLPHSGRGEKLRRAAFLDRDGVINVDTGYVHRAEDFVFVPGTLQACQALAAAGWALVVVTNQSGIGRGLYAEADFLALTQWMRARFQEAGAPLAGVYFCPHHPDAAQAGFRVACDCRKPRPGMLLAAAAELALDLPASILFGDRCEDLAAAQAAGVQRRILLGKDGRALPSESCPPGLALASFACLADAVSSRALAPMLAGSAHA
jgi:D-glycero-D-manno-heptose 1,7-bisphosphate phosphatase